MTSLPLRTLSVSPCVESVRLSLAIVDHLLHISDSTQVSSHAPIPCPHVVSTDQSAGMELGQYLPTHCIQHFILHLSPWRHSHTHRYILYVPYTFLISPSLSLLLSPPLSPSLPSPPPLSLSAATALLTHLCQAAPLSVFAALGSDAVAKRDAFVTRLASHVEVLVSCDQSCDQSCDHRTGGGLEVWYTVSPP